jgi:tetratricopeptide (TPR) repeat protein
MMERAAQGLRAALQVRTRRKAPIAWAATMTDLGYILMRLGDRETGTARYEEALRCFQNAALELPISRSPRDFAEAHGNLAAILLRIAERTGDVSRLPGALEALDLAARAIPRAESPLDWAGLQHTRAVILLLLGEARGDTDYLRDALNAADAALSVFSPELGPERFIATQALRARAADGLRSRHGGLTGLTPLDGPSQA